MIAILVSPAIQTASIGIPDTMFLMVLALIVFGPRRLPEIGRQIGKLMYEFRKVSNDFKFQMEEELRASEEAARQQKLEASKPPDLVPDPVRTMTYAPPSALTSGEPSPELPPEPPLGEVAPEGYDLTSVASAASTTDAHESRAEPRRFPPHIQPPAGGEPILAQRPFRSRVDSEPGQEADLESSPESSLPYNPASNMVTESGAPPETAPVTAQTTAVAAARAEADPGRIGTEVQPGVPESSRMAAAPFTTQQPDAQQQEIEQQEVRHA